MLIAQEQSLFQTGNTNSIEVLFSIQHSAYFSINNSSVIVISFVFYL